MFLNSPGEVHDYKLTTEEKYELTMFGEHSLILSTYATDETGKRTKVHTTKVKIPKEVPTYLTKYNLWNHTDLELKELENYIRENPEVSIKQNILTWKSWISKLE